MPSYLSTMENVGFRVCPERSTVRPATLRAGVLFLYQGHAQRGPNMIRPENGKYVAYCDGECGAVVHTGLRSFYQAINYISRAEGWDNRKRDDGWHNYCQSCAEY